MPCRYNTFDVRLLWFDGIEGKRGLTLTVVVVDVVVLEGAGGGGVKLFHCYSAYWCLWHTMRLTSFRHYYFPQVLSMVT